MGEVAAQVLNRAEGPTQPVPVVITTGKQFEISQSLKGRYTGCVGPPGLDNSPAAAGAYRHPAEDESGFQPCKAIITSRKYSAHLPKMLAPRNQRFDARG